MKKLKLFFSISLAVLALNSCSLHEDMVTSGSKELIFGSTQGLEAYALSLYEHLPSLSDLSAMEGTSIDIGVSKSVSTFYTGSFTAETETSWSWSKLRAINYFIDGIHSDVCTVRQEDKDHYEGLARWFRAYFYYKKLVSYGPVPWFEHCLSNTDLDEMYKNRDSRDVIIDNIIKDLDFAATHIMTTESIGNTRISKNAAYALKSRACLFEASWRRYHNADTELYTAEDLYNLTIDASQVLIDDSRVKLNTAVCTDSYLQNNPSLGAYRSLFYSKEIMTDEVILGVQASLADLVTGDANWYYNSATYGSGCCLSRAFIFTYLCTDGTRFTDKKDYSTIQFIDEFDGRDLRLAQTVKSPNYLIYGDGYVITTDWDSWSHGNGWRDRRPHIVEGTAVTGYQPIKFIEDTVDKNGTNKNENSLPIIRYAEILLNYAEAKAELGKLTDTDWANTIGAIRLRAGFQDKAGVTSTKPTSVDPYLQELFYPNVNDPVILEIRRERAIELVYEGFREADIRRWAEGKIYERIPMSGIHLPFLDKQFKVNHDNTADFYASYSAYEDVPTSAQNKHIPLLPDDSLEQGLRAVENPAGGYDLLYVTVTKRKWFDDDRQYLDPIPAAVIREYASRGYKLDQNPGW